MTEPATSIEVEVQPDPEVKPTDQPTETKTDPSATASEAPQTAATETAATADDYLGKPERIDWEKRYADSSREGKRQAERASRILKVIESDPELKEVFEEKSKSLGVKIDVSRDEVQVDAPTSDEPEEKVSRKDQNAVITMFEQHHGITLDQRKVMAPYVKSLVSAGVPLYDALNKVFKDMVEGRTAKADDTTATVTATHAAQTGSSAANSPKRPVSTGSKLVLTQKEYDYARRMGAVGEDGKLNATFAQNLMEIRKNK